jgi:preprotein translocase subunit YajC
MEQSIHQPSPLMSLLPFLLFTVALIFVIHRLAKEKGKNVRLWTILACIPLVNMIILPYIVGTPSKTQEDKLNKILELLNKENQE